MRLIYLLVLISLSNMVMADWVNSNTGIDDDLTGVVFWGDYGIVTGNAGLYYTLTGGVGSSNWSRFNISGNTSDSIIYNNTQFNHCYADRYWGGQNKVFACGQDTVNGTSVIMQINLPDLDYTIIHIGPANSSLNSIGFDGSYDKYFAVGDDGLIISFTSTSATIVDTSLTYDLYSIDFAMGNFWIAADSVNIFGSDSYSGIEYTVTSADSNTYKDIKYTSQFIAYAAGNSYYKTSVQQVTEYPNYDFGPLNGNCISQRASYIFVGTDHGIFRSTGAYNATVLEYQPSSGTLEINEFWNGIDNPDYFFACGDDGVLLRTDDNGGPAKPYANLSLEGGCVNYNILFSGETGSSTNCLWYIDDVLVHNDCDNFWHQFASTGIYTIKLIVSNESGLGDTAVQDIHIVEVPEINKPVTISDDILCHSESIDITIESTQNDVYYRLMKHGDYYEYGHSDPGNGNTISFASDSLNMAGNYYIRSQSTFATCYDNFTDSINIDVEYTKAQFHNGVLNVIPGEPVNFYQNCNEAQFYEWEFPQNANYINSNLPDPVNYFTSADSTQIKLVTWSDYGCYDSITTAGPMVYDEPSVTDSCWTTVNDAPDLPWPGYDTPDISQLIKSKSGYITCGYFEDMLFGTQHGSTIDMQNKSGGYTMKYNSDGAPKWMTRTVKSLGSYERCRSVVEDDFGNIYIAGVAKDFFIDNQGDTTYLRTGLYYPSTVQYIVKLDSLGRKLWVLASKDMDPTGLTIDNSNNLIVAARIDGSNIPTAFNGIPTDTIARISPSTCNYSIIKILQNGTIAWDAGIELNAVNGREITKVDIDSQNNIYFTGKFEQNAWFYSANSSSSNHLPGYGQNYGAKLFLAKYNSSGLYQWSLRSNTTGLPNDLTYPQDMSTDDAGNCYISGRNSCHNPDYYTHIIENTDGSTTSRKVGEYFIAKVNSEGICQWIQGSKYAAYGFGHNVSLFDSKLIVLGQVMNHDFSPLTLTFSSYDGSTIDMTIQYCDYFIAVYDTSGNLLEMHKNGDNEGGVNSQIFAGLFLDENGYYYSAQNLQINEGATYENFDTILTSTVGMDGMLTKFKGGCGISYYPTPVGIDVIKPNTPINIYPNPVTDILYIEGLESINNHLIKIIDAKGETVMTTSKSQSVNIKNLPAGLYYIIVYEDNLCKYKGKVIKL